MFEGRRRQRQADQGIQELHSVVDTLITIPNNKLLQIAGETTSMMDAFGKVDDVLLNAVRGISDLINVAGLINVDFADVKTIMSSQGLALMGTGTSAGANRAVEAANAAIHSPLLDDVSIHGAMGILINITGGPDLTLHEVNAASTAIADEAHEDANIIFGSVVDDSIRDEVRITVIATGFETPAPARRAPARVEKREPSHISSRPGRREDDRDVPTVIRRQRELERARPREAPSLYEAESGSLDIPTFLRRQAD
jgi:cell division protein FtsZ